MGKVAAKVKVMPNSPDIDLDALQERLESALPEVQRSTASNARKSPLV